MLPLYRDAYYTFRFAEARTIPRFHLEGVQSGTHLSVFAFDPATKQRLGLIARAIVGADGWVELLEPILVRAGEAFIAIPENAGSC